MACVDIAQAIKSGLDNLGFSFLIAAIVWSIAWYKSRKR